MTRLGRMLYDDGKSEGKIEGERIGQSKVMIKKYKVES